MILIHLAFSFTPFLDSSSFSLSLSLHFIWIVFFFFSLQLQPRMTPIQREQEMMSAPRLSGCNQLWLVAAATFWEEHIKILLLGVRVGEMGWGGGNYILTTNLLPTLGEVQASKSPECVQSPPKSTVSEHLAPLQQLLRLMGAFFLSGTTDQIVWSCVPFNIIFICCIVWVLESFFEPLSITFSFWFNTLTETFLNHIVDISHCVH